jgi:hypothetical protein
MIRQSLAALVASTLLAVTPVAAQDNETWLPSLVTETPQEGFDLAVSMARRAVKTTQPEVDTLMELRPAYSQDADSLIEVSGVVASWFATIAAANDYWRE